MVSVHATSATNLVQRQPSADLMAEAPLLLILLLAGGLLQGVELSLSAVAKAPPMPEPLPPLAAEQPELLALAHKVRLHSAGAGQNRRA